MDQHHNRVRYSWEIHKGKRLLLVGLDIVTLADTGLIQRIDGFFGPLASIEIPGPSKAAPKPTAKGGKPRP
jgi:hypothetical protein